MPKNYIAFFIFCIVVILIGFTIYLPHFVVIDTIGNNPHFLFSFLILLFSIICLAGAITVAYTSYYFWTDEKKAREGIKRMTEQMSNHYGIFHFLVITNVSFTLWFFRILGPFLALGLYGYFLLFLYTFF